MQGSWERFKIFVPLAAGVYLGFYAFALLMGVFSLTEIPPLTIIAAACVAGLIAYAIARRRGIYPISPFSPLARRARSAREDRGF